jgi:hypothetical protein
MCDDILDDFDDSFDDINNDADFEDEGCEVDDLIGDDDDFMQASPTINSNPDDCHAGLDMDDFILGAGLGFELGLDERRRRRLRNTDKF